MSRGTRGFSLMETLVAFVVLSLVTAALYRGFIDNAAGTADTITRYETLEAARSLFEELTGTARPDRMPREGVYRDHWRWHLEVERRYLDDVTRYRNLGGLFDLTLKVTGPSGQPVTVETTVLRSMR